MPVGELFINKDANGTWQDAYKKWGLSMSDTGLSALMTPPPHKEYISDECRSNNGKSVIVDVKIQSRTVAFPIHITAPDKETFYKRYLSFCEELKKGWIYIKTKYEPDVVYKFVYLDCKQYTQFMRQMAHMTISLEEPNPADRT